MIRDDVEACLQAYRFAELFLAGALEKPEKERAEALAAARKLRADVEPRYDAALVAPGRSAEQRDALRLARARLDEKLAAAAVRSDAAPPSAG